MSVYRILVRMETVPMAWIISHANVIWVTTALYVTVMFVMPQITVSITALVDPQVKEHYLLFNIYFIIIPIKSCRFSQGLDLYSTIH